MAKYVWNFNHIRVRGFGLSGAPSPVVLLLGRTSGSDFLLLVCANAIGLSATLSPHHQAEGMTTGVSSEAIRSTQQQQSGSIDILLTRSQCVRERRTPLMSAKTQFGDLGAYVAQRRFEAGIDTQAELARRLGITQQTVSRWEAGSSRPPEGQIGSLAAALGADEVELRRLAGYPAGPVSAAAACLPNISFDQPFPLGGMDPASFERLVADFVQARNPNARVHRAGGTGHTQDGIDVEAEWDDGRRHTFQCKRVAEFGPAKVEKAVAADATQADRKFLVLSRVASPQARAALSKYPNWELWDSDDISRMLRELPQEELRRLVRIYFTGQEMQLLGTTRESPWQKPEEFFAPFARADGLFTHAWHLVGRGSLISDIRGRLDDDGTGVVVVTGSAGSGKSRLLKEIIEPFASAHPAVTVRVALATPEITRASLEDLRQGRQLLVVDDAHDRDDLAVLFSYAATHPERVKLLIVARTYGFDHIKAQAASYSFAEPGFARFSVEPLSKAETESLAEQVLRSRGAPVEFAPPLAEFTRDCPLATVIGGQVVAESKVHPLLAQGEEVFRSALYGRFEDVIAGQLHAHEDPERIRKVMAFVALNQPIAEEDRNLLAAMEVVDGIKVHDCLRILNLLIKAGILFKRGSRYRLAPDVLGDFLIEKHFEGPGGRSNGLAEAYFDALPEGYIQNLILNMGRVDWRRSGQSGDSPLLDGIFARLKAQHEYSDPHIKAVTAVAYYQPRRALEFAERLVPQAVFNGQLADIPKYAAFSDTYLVRSLECLWALARTDSRETNPHASHPVRILTDLANPQLNKPLSVNEAVLDFCIELAADDANWEGRYTPFDIIEGLLATEGHTNTYAHHAITFHPFIVPPDWVAALRARTVDFLLTCLASPNIRKAAGAAKALGTALRLPMGLFGNRVPDAVTRAWHDEFATTLFKIERQVRTVDLDQFVQTEISRAVSWLAMQGTAKLKSAAKAVQHTLPSSLGVRMDRVLTDGYGMEGRRWDRDDHEERWNKSIATLVADIRAAFHDNRQLVAEIDGRLDRAQEAGPGKHVTPEVLVIRLITEVEGFAEAVLDAALEGSSTHVARYSGFALARVLRGNNAEGRRRIQSFMATDSLELKFAVSNAYVNLRYSADWFIPEDETTLRALLASEHAGLVQSTVRAVRSIMEWNIGLAADLVRGTNITTEGIADEVATLFEFGTPSLSVENLTEEDVVALLVKLRPLPTLDGHWLQKLLAELSERFAWQLATFFMGRVEDAARPGETRIRPCNHGPWLQEPLRFRRSPEGGAILRAFVAWMQKNAARKDMFSFYSRELFDVMFAPFDAEIVGFLTEWLATATPRDIELIAGVLHEAPRDFVFREAAFVWRLLEKARQAGAKTYNIAEGALYGSAISGVKSGTAGQPFPEDIALRDQAEASLGGLSRFAPSRPLYEALKAHASSEIGRALKAEEEDE